MRGDTSLYSRAWDPREQGWARRTQALRVTLAEPEPTLCDRR
ncbi:hypothetical protein STXM2123_3507 [Streptomyces sp. F-3]|nr:hypothetical protein STXM2123_3507 [Streptomyces sp. F-3]